MKLRHPVLVSLLLVGSACGSHPVMPVAGHAAPVIAAAYAPEDDVVVPIASDDAVRGNRLAPVTIVVFSDLQCSFCARLDGTLDRLRETYGDAQLRIVFKNDPLRFHPQARLAAEIGQGVLALAGPEAFWRYTMVAFHKQREMSPESLRTWAIGAGADGPALEAGLGRGTWTAKIERDITLAGLLKVDGTPASFVNGIMIGGARPYDDFKAIIDEQLDQAKPILASGPRDLVYKKLAIVNYRPAEDDDDDSDAARAAADAREAAETKVVHKVPTAGAPTRGPADALLTIVEFSDFQCPYCKRGEETVAQIRKEYGDKVRVVWRDDPLSGHPHAEPAAELARFARTQKGDAGFWAVHDALFASQPNLEDADLERIAVAAGLDPKKAMLAVSTHLYRNAIDDDLVLADDFDCSGTPHFFVNGHRVAGAKSFEKFTPLLDDELAKAEGLVKTGTPRAKVYEATIKDGVGPGEPVKKAIAAPASPAPFRGAANAKVVIEEVGDFQCPYCKRGDATMDLLLERYPGQIKVIWRDKPLSMHKDAPLAAEAAREAFAQKGNEGFQRMHKLLFENQGALGREDLDRYAAVVGLDMVRFAKALDEHTHKAVIDADTKLANDAGLSGTPGFFVGNYFVSGAASYPRFKKLVDLSLKK